MTDSPASSGPPLTRSGSVAAVSVLAAGPGISRLRARELARRELARGIYKPSLLARLWHHVAAWLASLTSSSAAGRLSWWGVTLIAVVVLAAIATALYWLGPASVGGRARARPVAGPRPRGAAEHRSAADQLAASGDYQGAIIERVRAIAADLEAREVLLPRPARTAIELAAEAAAVFPAESASLSSAAWLFDDVRYGGRAGTQSGYLKVADLDARLRTASAEAHGRPGASVPAGLPAAGVVLAGRGQSSGAESGRGHDGEAR